MILAALQTFSNISELARFSERYFFRNRGGKLAGQISPSALQSDPRRAWSPILYCDCWFGRMRPTHHLHLKLKMLRHALA